MRDSKFRQERDHYTAPLFASAAVIVLGLVGGLAIIYPFSSDPTGPLILLGGGLLLAAFFVILLRYGVKTVLGEHSFWILGKRPRGEVEYEPRLIKDQPQEFGTHQPLSLDELKHLKDESSHRNWVPSNTASASEKPPHRKG